MMLIPKTMHQRKKTTVRNAVKLKQDYEQRMKDLESYGHAMFFICVMLLISLAFALILLVA